MRWVIRSPFSKPPVEISFPEGFLSLNANPTSMRVAVVALVSSLIYAFASLGLPAFFFVFHKQG